MTPNASLASSGNSAATGTPTAPTAIAVTSSTPAAVCSATETDPAGRFLRLHVVFEPGATVARKELRETYEAWCERHGHVVLDARQLAARLREHGVRDTNVRRGAKVLDGWRNVRLIRGVHDARSAPADASRTPPSASTSPSVLAADTRPPAATAAAPFRNAHLSYSRISRYEQCPRAFKLHYVDGMASEPGPELEFGKAMHAVLEQLVGEHALSLEPAPLSVEQAERLWQEEWVNSGLIGICAFYEGLRMLRAFAQSEGVLDPASILAVEQPFEIQIGRFKVVGAIDRVDRAGDRGIVIRDYKTSRLIPSREELTEHLQLSLYAVAARQLWPWAEKIDLQLDMLRHDLRLRTSRTDDELDAARRYVEALGERTEADQVFAPRPNPYCGHCDYRAHCPVYAEALAGKRTIVAVDMADLEKVAREREEVARIAKAAYGRKEELDRVLKARLDRCDHLELAGVCYELQPITSKEYPVDATARLLQEATGLPPETVLAKVAAVDRDSLTKLLAELGKKLPRPRVTLLRAELEARAVKSTTQRLAAKPMRA
jgi:putative RecB family exonuclease